MAWIDARCLDLLDVLASIDVFGYRQRFSSRSNLWSVSVRAAFPSAFDVCGDGTLWRFGHSTFEILRAAFRSSGCGHRLYLAGFNCVLRAFLWSLRSGALMGPSIAGLQCNGGPRLGIVACLGYLSTLHCVQAL